MKKKLLLGGLTSFSYFLQMSLKQENGLCWFSMLDCPLFPFFFSTFKFEFP